MKNYLKSNSIAFLITFAALLYGLSVAGSFPEMVASHCVQFFPSGTKV